MERTTPDIRLDVPGPGGQSGFLLYSPRTEAIEWDIQNEIASTSRYWLEEQQAWWVATYYLATARDIVRRFTPPAPIPLPEQVAVPAAAVPEPPLLEVVVEAKPAPAPVPASWGERLVAVLRRLLGTTTPAPPPGHPARRAPSSPAR